MSVPRRRSTTAQRDGLVEAGDRLRRIRHHQPLAAGGMAAMYLARKISGHVGLHPPRGHEGHPAAALGPNKDFIEMFLDEAPPRGAACTTPTSPRSIELGEVNEQLLHRHGVRPRPGPAAICKQAPSSSGSCCRPTSCHDRRARCAEGLHYAHAHGPTPEGQPLGHRAPRHQPAEHHR
ncbi:MAG: hypothetical protein M0C28_41090 [Candidatus Moduliflexus flocculans]|nr:hypothetical protein [Candidatus Moduliflexus flocculans]